MQTDTQYLQSLDRDQFTDQQKVTDFQPWGFFCCKAVASDFRVALQPDTLFELPPGSGEGSCNGPNDTVNEMIQLKVDQNLGGEVSGRCFEGLVPCEISIKGDLINYLNRKRPCTYRPVISLGCSLSPDFQGLIRTSLASQKVDFVDENVAPRWSTSLLDLGSISEYSATGTWLLIPQLDGRLFVSEEQDVWGSENWKVRFSVGRKLNKLPILEVHEGLGISPSTQRSYTGKGLSYPALRLARSIPYYSCQFQQVRLAHLC